MDYEKIIKQMIADEAISKEVAAKYFPELKESEGERIRENLITFFKNKYGTNSTVRFAGFKVKDILAWLEKQGEQKLTPIFRIGDTIIAKDETYIEKEPFRIDRIEDDCYWDGENTILVCNQDEFEIFKQNPAEWTAEDETSIAVNNPEAYRIGFADGEAHTKEEMIEKAIKWVEYNNKNGGCEFDGWVEDIKQAMEDE